MISIIVVGYNSKKDLPECFDSIQKSTFKKYRIIFVDNDSTDGSLDFVKNKYPEIITIKNKNTGYAGGNNVGIRKAIEFRDEYVFLLNPDTIIDKDCLAELITKADKKTVLQPLILLNINGKNTDLINTTGGHLNFLGFSYCSDYKEDKSIAKEKDIAIASGAAVFMPTSMFEEIGFLDESFFMYHEDVDLFWRARLSGFNIKLIPSSVLWHKYSFSKNKNKLFYAERNRLVFLYKNFPLRYRILILPAFVINEILMLIYSLLTGWSMLKIKAYGSAISNIFKLTIKPQKLSKKNKFFIQAGIQFSELKSPVFIPYNVFLTGYWYLIKYLI